MTTESTDSTTSDAALLRTLATAIIKLADSEGPRGPTGAYNEDAVRALNGVVLACLALGARPPTGLPELLRWCRTRPLEDWPLDLPRDEFGPEDRLLDERTGEPTQICHEWWVDGKDRGAAEYDREIIHAAMKLCRAAESPESYTAFRRLLVAQPVLTPDTWLEVDGDLYLSPVRDLVKRVYIPVPDSYSRGGRLLTCGRCGTLLTPTTDGDWWCERDQCRSHGPAPHGIELLAHKVGPVLHLVRPLRKFVTGPGLAEVDLEHRLKRLRDLKIEMWPGYDAYDIRLTFPDGHVWAVDVKDWAYPSLLARRSRQFRQEPPYDEAYLVVPQFRVDIRPDYLKTFERNRTGQAAGLQLKTDRQLAVAAADRLRACQRDTSPTDVDRDMEEPGDA